MRLQQIAISQIKPSSRNSRTHSAKQIRQIADSIVAFGFTNPLLVSEDNELIAGHGRYEAAKLLGLTEVPVIAIAGLFRQNAAPAAPIGPALVRELQNAGLSVTPVKPKHDKKIRMSIQSGKFASGRVFSQTKHHGFRIWKVNSSCFRMDVMMIRSTVSVRPWRMKCQNIFGTKGT